VTRSASLKSDPKALEVDVDLLLQAWTRWLMTDGDGKMDAVERSVARLRADRAGTRWLNLNRDSNDVWRPRCKCGWKGNPQSDGHRGDAGWRTGQGWAIREFGEHDCLAEPTRRDS
jgi:hypothetical protein